MRKTKALGFVVLGSLLFAGCAENAPLDTLSPEGPIARQIDGLWDIVFWMAVAVFVVVEGAIVFALFKFRARRNDSSEPVQSHGNTKLEIAWTIAPILLLATLIVPTVTTIFALAREPEDPLRVTVTGKQWWWAYEYPELGVVTANELHIPIDKPVYLTLESDDVIHSYWVPKLAGKQDVVPGRQNFLTIEAEEPGVYDGTCVEYCGLSHANMRLKVFAHTPEDFETWVAEQAADAVTPSDELSMEGREIFEGQACAGCHAIRGTSAAGTVGPDLTHFASRTTFAGAIFDRNDEALLEWLRDAPGVKPGSKMPAGVAELGLSDDDITALLAYLNSLR